MTRRAIEDQFAHRLSGRGRVEHAPDAVAGRHVGTLHTRHAADQRQAILGDRPKARLSRLDRRRGERRRDVPAHRLEPRVRTLVRRDVGGIDGHRPGARDRAHPGRAIGARKQLGSEDFAARLAVLEEQCLRGNGLAGLEHEAMALVAEHRRQRQPTRRQDRPRSHGDDHGVAFDDLAALERDAAYGSARVTHQRPDRAVPQLRAMRLGRAHQTRREGAGLDQRRRLRRAEPTRDRHAFGQPRSLARTPSARRPRRRSRHRSQDADSSRDCRARRRVRRAARSCAAPVDRAGCRGTSRAPGSRPTCRRPRRRLRDAR